MTSKHEDLERLETNASQDLALFLANNTLNISMEKFEESHIFLYGVGLEGLNNCFPSMYVITVIHPPKGLAHDKV
jgi:hypothetical protein